MSSAILLSLFSCGWLLFYFLQIYNFLEDGVNPYFNTFVPQHNGAMLTLSSFSVLCEVVMPYSIRWVQGGDFHLN